MDFRYSVKWFRMLERVYVNACIEIKNPIFTLVPMVLTIYLLILLGSSSIIT